MKTHLLLLGALLPLAPSCDSTDGAGAKVPVRDPGVALAKTRQEAIAPAASAALAPTPGRPKREGRRLLPAHLFM